MDTYLVQRLTPPRTTSPFSFGGGLINGGLNKEVFDLLNPIFGFDYMGSAEFEFGALPEALQKLARLAQDGSLVRISVEIEYKDDLHTLWVICTGADAPDDVAAHLASWVGDWDDRPMMKELPQLDHTLDSDGDDLVQVIGWLSLDDPLVVFTTAEPRDQLWSLLTGEDVS